MHRIHLLRRQLNQYAKQTVNKVALVSHEFMIAGLTEEEDAPWNWYDRILGRHICESGLGIYYSQFIGLDQFLSYDVTISDLTWPGLTEIQSKKTANSLFISTCTPIDFTPTVVFISPQAMELALCVLKDHANFAEMRFVVAPGARDYESENAVDL